MKKAAIIIGVIIYALSIIVVTFLGYAAEIKNPPVFADDIVFAEEVPYEYVVNGAVVYKLKAAQNKHIKEEEENTSLITYRYEIEIVEFEYLIEVLDGEMDVICKPISYKVDEETGVQKTPEVLDLNYTSGNEKLAVVNNKGRLTFKQNPDLGQLDLVVSTKDTTNIKIFIKISWDIFMN